MGKKIKIALLVLAAGFAALNGMAFMQAWRMTHFVAAGARTAIPEKLGLLAKARAVFTGVTIPKPFNDQTPADFNMKYKAFFVEGNGPKLEAWEIPGAKKGVLVIMLHGYAGHKSGLLPEAAKISRMGYEIWMADFRGCGGSEGFSTGIGYTEAADVARLLEYAKARYPKGRIVIFATSMGAAATLHAAAQFKVQPDAAILEFPFDTLLHTAQNRFELMGLPSFPAAPLLVFWGGVQQGYNALGFAPAEDAKAFTARALLMAGENDPRARLGQVRRVYDNLAGVKEMVVFEGAAHESLLKADGGKWKAKIAGVLKGE